MAQFIGRGGLDGPVTAFFPLSGASASNPAIVLTATVAAGAQTIHTADPNSQDVLYVTVGNSGTTTVNVYAMIGTTATTSAIPLAVTNGTFGLLFNGNVSVSKSGTVTIFSTLAASSGVTMYGFVARTYTATS